MQKSEVLKIIDEVMNNREIDSIRNAILAIRDKVIEAPDISEFESEYTAKLPLRGGEISFVGAYFEGAKYICIDTAAKVDTGIYGEIWYE